MDRWQNKVAVVTGASSGIGAACVQYLLKHGMIVVGLARRLDRMESIRSELPEDQGKRFHPKQCDLAKEEDILASFAWIESELGGVDVLVNNAGVVKDGMLTAPNNTADIKTTVDVNILAVVYCSREAVQSMKKRGVDGHILHINSVAGHMVPLIPGFTLNIYPSTKHAVTAMTEVMRQEFMLQKTGIKVTSISPGGVRTEMVPPETSAEIPLLRPEDIADAVVYCLQTPTHVQIHEMIIRPVGENF